MESSLSLQNYVIFPKELFTAIKMAEFQQLNI